MFTCMYTSLICMDAVPKERLRNEFGHWVFDILCLQSTTSSGIWDCWHRFTLTCWATGSNILSIVFVWKTGILLALWYSPQKLLIFKKTNVCVESGTLKSEGSDLGHWMNTWSRHHNLVNVVVSYKNYYHSWGKKTLFKSLSGNARIKFVYHTNGY